jgi:Crinkler effector protein N-terminal domain
MVKLFCALVGEKGNSFPVKIDESESVGDLKDAIKQKKERTITCDADNLNLFLGKTSDHTWLDSSAVDAVTLNGDGNPKGFAPMDASLWINNPNNFGENFQPNEGEIHVLVVVPKQETSTLMVTSMFEDSPNQRKRQRAISSTNFVDGLRSEDITNEQMSIENDILNVQSNQQNPISLEELGKVMTVPHDAPQAFTFSGNTFYIRSCYHKYYDIIMDTLLGKYSYISVTGTPGIGKSMFYLYFLNRYQLENPGKSVIVASFGKQQNIIACKVFRPNGVVEKCTDISGGYMIPVWDTKSWPKGIDCDLYLYDGPPLGHPPDVKMIAFTSPHFMWLSSMRKHASHLTLFMPTWDLNELCVANEILQLNIDKNELIKQYALFGGSARYCLSTSPTFISSARSDIDTFISEINDIFELKKLFIGTSNIKDVVHHIMQFIPEDSLHMAKLYPASPAISIKLYKQIKEKLIQEQVLLMDYLNGIEKGSIYSAWLFETSIHDCFLNGGTFEMQSLKDSSKHVIHIDQTIGEYSPFSMKHDQGEVFTNIYRIPKASNYPSIDSYIITDKLILMFQMTKSERHPVKSSGLVSFLQSVNQLSRVQADPLLAQLIFVVPKGMGHNFHLHYLESSKKRTGSIIEVVDCEKIPGIGPKKSKILSDLGIKDSAKWIEACDFQDPCIKLFPNMLNKSLENSIDDKFLKNIPQYVIEVDNSIDTDLYRVENA